MNRIQNQSVILPVRNPMITSYTTDTNMLAILQVHPSTEEWIYNQFVSLWGEAPDYNGNILLLRYHTWNIRRICPYLKTNILNSSHIDRNIIDFIISKINSGYYLEVLYDQYYIPESSLYQQEHFNHSMLIHGYDNQEKVFYIADFYRNNSYIFTVAPFACVEKAILNAMKAEDFYCDEIEFVDIKYKFNNYFFFNSLNNFLYSKNRIAENENIIITDAEAEKIEAGKYTFGIENYNLVNRTLAKMIEYKLYIDENADAITMRPLHVIWEHKVMMLRRLEFLVRKGIIDADDPIKNTYTKIHDICLANRNLFIKFAIANDFRLIEKTMKNVNTMISLETEAVTCLMEKLSKTYAYTIP